jgi:hypothetical protein
VMTGCDWPGDHSASLIAVQISPFFKVIYPTVLPPNYHFFTFDYQYPVRID